MTMHISARVAWHDSGWNGRMCKNPKANTYCIGQYSFLGEVISERRDLDWEQQNASEACNHLDRVPPCIYSINTFGTEELQCYSPPPDWFRDQ